MLLAELQVLEELEKEIQEVTPKEIDLFEPEKEIDPTSQMCIGTVSEILKRIHVILCKLSITEKEVKLEINGAVLQASNPLQEKKEGLKEEIFKKYRTLAEIKRKKELLQNLFWAEIEKNPKIPLGNHILNIPKGWKIFVMEETEKPNTKDKDLKGFLNFIESLYNSSQPKTVPDHFVF